MNVHDSIEDMTVPVVRPLIRIDSTQCTYALETGLIHSLREPEDRGASDKYWAAQSHCQCMCPCICVCQCPCICQCPSMHK